MENDEIKKKLQNFIGKIFYKDLSSIRNSANLNHLNDSNDSNDLNDLNDLNNLNNTNTKIIETDSNSKLTNSNFKSTNLNSNPTDYCIFNQAPDQGLWYNWATDVGKKYCAISYSAGTTWIFNKSMPLVPPIIYIFDLSDVKCSCEEPKFKPKPKYTLNFQIDIINGIKTNELKVNGIRSLLLVEDCVEPYCLIGTFEYPTESKIYNVKLLKWNFISNMLDTIYTETDDNSIRQIIRYKTNEYDLIFFSTQNDTATFTKSKIYWMWTKTLKNFKKCEFSAISAISTINFTYKNKYLIGSIWDFYIDLDTMYLSIPLMKPDPNKLSGLKILARLFYLDIKTIFCSSNSKKIKKVVCTRCLIGQSQPDSLAKSKISYPPGFNIDSISTVQIITSPSSKYVYIYSLSDFLYQISLINNPSVQKKIQNKIQNKIVILNNDKNILDQHILLDFILELRSIVLDFDIEGTKIFRFKKSNLFKKSNPLISTIVGNPPYSTLNLSNTSNGYDSYTNLYTWCATSSGKDFYFGTLDLRSQIYKLIILLLNSFLQIPGLYEFLINLPQDQIIIITELFNPNFCIGNLTDFSNNFSNKKLYFDIIKITDSNVQNKITSSGFNQNNGLNPNADDGVRNLNIIETHKKKQLLIGTTCYQTTNVAKNYLINLDN